MQELVICVDLGGSKILSGIATTRGKVLKKIKQPTRVERGIDDILDRVCASIRQLPEDVGAHPEEIIGIAIGTPGPLDYYRSTIISTPNLGWQDVNLKLELSKRLNRPVIIDNDANMATLGEYYFGQHQVSDLLYMTVSTGIGGGTILNGKLYRGSDGGAGEFGHMVINPTGPVCKCGRQGCLEAIASGTAIAREARELVEKGQQAITAREVGEAARRGDKDARQIINRLIENLGIGIANLVNIFNPPLVILGGGVSVGLKDLLLEPVTDYVKKHVFALHSNHLQIKITALGEDAGLLGCVASVLIGEE